MGARGTRLPGDVEHLLAVGGGVFTTSAAVGEGVSHGRLMRLVQAGLLVRLAHGTYTSREEYEAMPPWSAFRLRSRAFTRACGSAAHASGWSAVAIYELPAIGPPPAVPSVAVPKGTASAGDFAFGRVRSADLPPGHRSEVDGCPIVSMSRTVIDVGRTEPRADAQPYPWYREGSGSRRAR